MKIHKNYPLANETTFRCGGKADWFCAPQDFAEFETLLKLHKGKFFVLGAGSKTLCPDSGFGGLVISTKHLNGIAFDGGFVLCDAGARFADLEAFCIMHGLGGLEWSASIPASVGGATVMNAGAFGHDFFESVARVEIFENGARKILEKNQIEFAYRKTSLLGKVVLRVWLRLEKKSPQIVQREFEKHRNKKLQNQPVFFGSAGSIFKRTENVIPAKIIDKLGLKGVKIGGAEISTHHSGFIVNTGSASASDVIALIDFVRKTVADKCKTRLENEVIIME